MNLQDQGQSVLVTGGSGFVGGWVVAALLEQGYRVRTTVRSLSREAEVRAAVARRVDAGDRLTFHAADLLADDGWDRATEGADFLIHVASPMPVGEYRGTDLVRPAREGTMRVLRAGEKANVRRFILTGSIVAASSKVAASEHPTNETMWTDPDAATTDEYARSKTLAERDAWDFVRQHRGAATLTTILPGMIQGPVLGKDVGGSAELVQRMLTGRMPGIPRIGFGMVDVRDLAELHVRALTDPAAAGQRLFAVGEFLWLDDVARILRDRLGARAAQVPTRRLPDLVIRLSALFNPEARLMAPRLGQRQDYSAAKALQLLGWRTRPAADSIIDCAQSLIDLGHA